MDFEVKNKLLDIEKTVKDTFPNTSCYFRGEPRFYKIISAGLRRNRRIILPWYEGETPSMNPKMEGGIKFDEPQRVSISFERNRFIYHKVQNMVFELDIRNPDSLYEMAMVAGSFIEKQTDSSSDKETDLGILQHLGYPTPYLDFTKDYLVALFFACNKLPDEDGRVIILGNNGDYEIKDMTQAEFSVAKERAVAQKSVMLKKLELTEAEDDYKECCIPSGLKPKILAYLEDCGINFTSLFPDSWEAEKKYVSYKKFYQGVQAEIDGNALNAISFYTDAIGSNPNFVDAYKRRARILYHKVDLRKAQSDIEKVFNLEKERGLYEIGKEDEVIGLHPFCDEGNAGCMHHILGKIYEHFGDRFESREYLQRAKNIQHRHNRREENEVPKKDKKG